MKSSLGNNSILIKNDFQSVRVRVLPTFRNVTIAITSRCSLACSFCYNSSDPSSKEMMTKERAVTVIHEIAEANIGVWHINIRGGEAILEPDTVRAVIDAATEHRILTSLTTSGFWSTDYKTAFDVMRDLRQRGLYELALSIDDEKAKTIPLKNIVYLSTAAMNLGVRICHYFRADHNDMTPPEEWARRITLLSEAMTTLLKNGDFPPLRDDWETNDLEEDWHPKKGDILYLKPYFIRNARLTPMHKHNAYYYNQKRFPFQYFANMRWQYEHPIVYGNRLVVVPNGDLWFCGAFKIGNLSDESLISILKRASQSSIYKKFYSHHKLKGVTNLAEFLDTTYGCTLTERSYTGPCHICAMINNVINFDGTRRKEKRSERGCEAWFHEHYW